ncbi:class I SAM-dependent methyltransferase [Candidatus Woesearchaeota archaeon]|nr:class I SAM-dependent methyltransferase [Candidatus Woesearchaeota archaeon]
MQTLKENPICPPCYFNWFRENAPPSFRHWFEKENEYIRGVIKRGSKVLDVGCGEGRSIANIVDMAGEIVGIDVDPGVIRFGNEIFGELPHVELYQADAREIPYSSGTFDYVICTGNSFGNMTTDRNPHIKERVLREMKRVVKERKGRIILSVLSENSLDERLKAYRMVYKNSGGLKVVKVENDKVYIKSGLVTEHFSKNKLRKLFNDAGLDVKIKPLNDIAYVCSAVRYD